MMEHKPAGFVRVPPVPALVESGRAWGHPSDGGAAGFDNVQNRQGERRGLARSAGRLTEKVASGEQPRYGLALNGGGLFVPKGGEHFENLGAEPERRESGRFGGRLFDVKHQNGSRGKAIVDSS